MRRPLLVSAVLACAACSAIAGLNKDYVVDESSTTPGVVQDAGEALPDADSGGAIDAAVATPFCGDASALFCDDFEGDAGLLPPWTRTETTGGVPQLMPAIGVNASRALDARMTAASTATAATVAWRTVGFNFPLGSTITLTFSFNVTTKSTNYAALGVIQFVGVEHGLAMYDPSKCLEGVSCLDENDQTGRGHEPSNSVELKLGVWHTGLVSLTHLPAGGYSGIVKVDGAVVDNRATGAMPANANTSTVEVGVGSFYSSGAGTNDVVIDDVLVTNQLP